MAEQLDLFADRRPAAPDQADRDLVASALDQTLFVEAGAGSGKTTALVGRVVELVRSGVPIGSIAAITFTEKAAAELRHRIRAELTTLAGGTDAATRERLAEALADLDLAPIGTLHAFARRLLSEFPVEAALPPRFGVLDEVQSATAFHERFTDFLEALLDDPGAVRLVELCQHDGFGVEKGVRLMAEDFQANWDLVELRVAAEAPAPADDASLQRQVALRCRAAAGFRAPDDDTQVETIAGLADLAGLLEGPLPLAELLRILRDLASRKSDRLGNKDKWRKWHGDEQVLLDFRTAVADLATAAAAALQQCNEERRLTLGALLRAFTLDSVALRRQDGELEFHDLLVLARQLIATDEAVRTRVHERYTRLLLDEFQDTDPIQLELAVRITAPPGGQGPDWRSLRPVPGRLTVVGDPKQSIYRFRRADIGQFLAAREQLGARRATLRANFRSAAPVIEWVNHTMSTLIQAEAGVQPEYVPLVAARSGGHDHGTVTVLGAEAHTDLPRASAERLRELEAADVAAAVVQAITDGWPVWDRTSSDGQGALRPCRPGDIAILLPSRLSLPALQAALAAADVPSRAENSSLVYSAPEVRALLLALRAADDPTDELALVAALRTPLFGCSDRHLYEWRVTHARRFHLRRGHEGDGDEGEDPLADHPVARALQCVAALADRIPFQTPSQLLAWLVRERCVLELALARRDSRDVWRRVRFVVDQARAWSEAGGHGVRRYLLWTRLQGDDGRFVAETVLPERDHDVVRIMTVHAAKGLEFPITVLSGMTARGAGQRGKRVVWTHDSWVLSDRDDPAYQQFAPVDEQMSDAEKRRLLYVACTRAQDHLVVSLHRSTAGGSTAAGDLADACAGAGHRALGDGATSLPPAAFNERTLPWADEQRWLTTWQDDLARAAQPAALSATTLARRLVEPLPAAHDGGRADDAGLAKDPVDLDLPPWQRGRYGTAVGRAVHAVLQFASPASTDLASLAAAQAAAEGVLGHESTIERLARSALRAPLVADGMAGQHWRELFVATEIGGTVVEGYIDLLVRHPQRGLVVVDYKTDQVPSGPERDDRLRRYGTQLAAYGLALEQLLGEPISGGVLVMCRTGAPAEEVAIPEWEELQASLRDRLVAAR